MTTQPLSFDQRDGFIWMNGTMLDWKKAQVHVLTHGLHYGSSVFEGERAYSGKIFKDREHTERFHRSAELLGFTIPYSVDVLMAAKAELLKVNNIIDGYVRPVAFRGSEMMAISAQRNTIHVAIAAWSWPSMYKKDVKAEGVRLARAQYRRPSPETAPCASKAAGLYMICTVSKHEAERAGFDDALMLDYRGLVAEATGANLFAVMNGELHTPTPDCFLNGITRQTVMELARAAGITVVERHITPEELDTASEVFLTGTAAEITPVSEIAGKAYTIGPVTRKLMDIYAAEVRK
ncbi:MAG: branched-chain amino acid aminotransferase [Alphaproteobacteria bacterium]|nr:branched-chain amino acid aminotransferase [Alphaproteobacteria bacterium]